MRRFLFFLGMLGAYTSTALLARSETPSVYCYEPQVTTLQGIVRAQSAPDANGRIERFKALVLAKPIMTHLCTKRTVEGDPETNVTHIQLVNTANLTLPPAGTRVTATGKLFHAITAHHHTPVLIELESITPSR